MPKHKDKFKPGDIVYNTRTREFAVVTKITRRCHNKNTGIVFEMRDTRKCIRGYVPYTSLLELRSARGTGHYDESYVIPDPSMSDVIAAKQRELEQDIQNEFTTVCALKVDWKRKCSKR